MKFQNKVIHVGCMEIQEWTRTDRNGHRNRPEWTVEWTGLDSGMERTGMDTGTDRNGCGNGPELTPERTTAWTGMDTGTDLKIR